MADKALGRLSENATFDDLKADVRFALECVAELPSRADVAALIGPISGSRIATGERAQRPSA